MPAYIIIFTKNFYDYFNRIFSIGRGNPVTNDLYNGSLIAVILGAVFYLFLAIWMDYKNNKLTKTNEHHETLDAALVGQHVVAD